ncbi:MAG: signal peptide peptidase SppA [Pirellulales bacterium]|nr:signal peptide peptidase SppA [Pirellulales bacterium]
MFHRPLIFVLAVAVLLAWGSFGATAPAARADDPPAVAQKADPRPAADEKKDATTEDKKADEKKETKTAKPSVLSKLLKKATAKAQGATDEAKPVEEPKPEPKKDDAKQPAPKQAEPAKDEGKTQADEKKEGETPKPDDKKAEAKKRVLVVRIALRGSYPEGPTTAGPFGEMETSLSSLLKKFEQVAEDEKIAAVVLEVDEADVGGGKVHEIREAIARVRKAGKPIYAMLTAAEGGQYLIACACDEIVMTPSGVLVIPGVRADVMFYKGLLDKIGVKADMLQMGKYKGAGEPYTRSGMSPALRESFEAVVDDGYKRLVDTVAKDRKLEDYQVKTYIDQGLFTAAEAKKVRLIDQVLYVDEFLTSLKKRLGADELGLVTKYKSQSREEDFSGMAGMMKLLQIMMGGKPTATTSRNKKIAVIYAVGPIVQGKSSSSLFGESVLGSTTMVEALRDADKDPTVQAIVLRVDSPGGSAIASDLIWRETVRIKKPIIASMGDVAGSGGYYISVGADTIFAEPSTLTGSIGVIGGKLAIEGLYKKLGLTTETVSRGKNSGLFSSEKPFTPSEREALQAMMRETYRQFVMKSAQGRKMSYQKLDELAQGRIYTGNMAVANGLVDRIGTLADAVAEAKKAAGLKADEKVDLLILPQPRSIFEQLFGDPSATTEGRLAGLVPPLAQARVLKRLFVERVVTMMPCLVELK